MERTVYRIIEITCKEHLENIRWSEYLGLKRKISEMRGEPLDFCTEKELYATETRTFDANDAFRILLIEKTGKYFGYINLLLNDVNTEYENCFIRPYFLAPLDGEELQRDIARSIIDFYSGKRSIALDVYDDNALRLVDVFKGEMLNQTVNLKYSLLSFDTDYYKEQFERLRTPYSKFSLVINNSIEKSLLLEYFDVYQAVSEEENLSFNNLECKETFDEFKQREYFRQQSGEDYVYCMLFSPSGKLIGISTDCIEKKRIVRQEMTGVLQAFRGKGFGLLMKYYVYAHMRKMYPNVDEVTTVIAVGNKWMIAINEQMGFKKYRTDTRYIVSLDHLKRVAIG